MEMERERERRESNRGVTEGKGSMLVAVSEMDEPLKRLYSTTVLRSS